MLGSLQTLAGDIHSNHGLCCAANIMKLKTMMEQAGFEQVEYLNLTAGVVALHVGRVF